MQALALTVGTTNLELVERPEPFISAPDDVKVRIIRVGVCGTDREEARGGRGLEPDGSKQLVIGHEMFGQVVQVGKAVTRVAAGDFAVFSVRRGCGRCLSCAMNRPDMCRTGLYKERGIWGLDGYQTEFVVDKEQYVVRVPAELEPIGVLAEPAAVVEKAIALVQRIQMARLPDGLASPDWLYGRRCLVAGLGPIGLLGAMVLRLSGAQVYGLDIVDADTARPQWLANIGGHYIDGRKVAVKKVDDTIGAMDVILEAAGIPSLDFNLLDALTTDGVYVLTGIPGGSRPVRVDGATLMRQMVLNNQLMFGSVNAARDHFQMAVDHLEHAHLLWGDRMNGLITDHYPHSDFVSALNHHDQDEIKVVLEWGKA